MTFDSASPETAFAIDIVTTAARLARRIRAAMAAFLGLTKGDLSPVTVADFAIQALVAHALEESFPNDTLVAEEASVVLRTSGEVLESVTEFVREFVPGAGPDDVCRWIDRGAAEPGARWWTLDPIDGTKGYMRGGQYAVALALIQDGRVELGVLGCPSLGAGCVPEVGGPGVVVAAARGQGAWQRPLDAGEPLAPMRVSDCANPAQARLLRSHEAAHTNVAQTEELLRILGTQASPVLMDSMAKYAVLAAGNGELMVRMLSAKQPDYREKVWDVAAGSVVVQEAGGHISDLQGRSLDFTAGRSLAHNRGLLASNGRLHDTIVKALGEVLNK